ncbi:MAG: hypothetical protein OET79_03905, partial [Nitrospirota bacterium]|nr:hypothetical protein [Nitrospirota bacterium]
FRGGTQKNKAQPREESGSWLHADVVEMALPQLRAFPSPDIQDRNGGQRTTMHGLMSAPAIRQPLRLLMAPTGR